MRADRFDRADPAGGDLLAGLANVRVPVCLLEPAVARAAPVAPDGLVAMDIAFENGLIARIEPAAPPRAQERPGFLDGRGGICLPAFVDVHTHLDKAQIWSRTANPDGTFWSGLEAARADRDRHWTADDIRRRMEFSLASAYAHGTAAIRTHLDTTPELLEVSWPLFVELRETWRGRIALQAVSLLAIAELPQGEALAAFARRIAGEFGGILGGFVQGPDDVSEQLGRLFEAAGAVGAAVDLHVDETLDPASNALRQIADAVIRTGFAGPVTCGHCCSLMTQDETEALSTLDRVAEAGISIVSLPLCNAYLMDRAPGRTPRIRGGTLVHEMAERGIAVALASDNARDPFYAYGDLDALEVFRQSVRQLQLDHAASDWISAVTFVPAAIMAAAAKDGGSDLPTGRMTAGAGADLVLFEARNRTELLARPQSDRRLIRAGRVVTPQLPSYRDLDDLAHMRP